MPQIKANGLDIFYDEVGDRDAPAILLIMGLATQMIAWSDDFRSRLADGGFRVIRFDNRDIGLSQKMSGKVSLGWMLLRARLGFPGGAPYSLDDMALDAVGVLDALGVGRAHIVGASMGGMIAQIVAGRHGERCRSLTSIMSSSGVRGLPGPSRQVISVMTRPRPQGVDREAAIRFGMETLRAIGSTGFETSEADLRALVGASFDRSYHPAGFLRQLAAVVANGSRAALLKAIDVPTLVLHGEADPLVPVENGRDTHRRIAGSAFETIPGWGHDLPVSLMPRIAERIVAHCRQADAVLDA